MPRHCWELRIDNALDGVSNMRVDGDLLAAVDRSDAPRTILRFYTWVRPTISLGRNQNVDNAVDLEFCRANGVDVVHRPTGGRAVLHADELTYAVVSNEASRFDGRSVYGTYRKISEALGAGYRKLGVPVTLAPDTVRRRAAASGADYPCFVSASRYELMVDGRKIAGSAQRRLRRAFLQHGSMPITCDRGLLARATRLEDAAILDSEMAGIAECVAVRPTIDAMIEAFVSAFRECFDVELRGGNREPLSGPVAGS